MVRDEEAGSQGLRDLRFGHFSCVYGQREWLESGPIPGAAGAPSPPLLPLPRSQFPAFLEIGERLRGSVLGVKLIHY